MVRVLIADDDLDTHQFLRDVLEVHFRDVEIGKALTCDSLLKKLRESENPYNVVLLDYHLESEEGKDVISALREQAPEVLDRIVLLNGSPKTLEHDHRTKGMPRLSKPYSLDEFGDVLKRVVAS